MLPSASSPGRVIATEMAEEPKRLPSVMSIARKALRASVLGSDIPVEIFTDAMVTMALMRAASQESLYCCLAIIVATSRLPSRMLPWME